jgi:hypothetical protein
MHIQAKAAPARSPADLAEFLRVLAASDRSDRDAINIEGVTGAALESGGHLVFTVAHDREQEAHDWLTDERYTCSWTKDLYHETIPPEQVVEPDPNQPGVLAGIVQRAKDSSIADNREIDTVLLGAFTDEPGHFYVQVTFVGSTWMDHPEADDS